MKARAPKILSNIITKDVKGNRKKYGRLDPVDLQSCRQRMTKLIEASAGSSEPCLYSSNLDKVTSLRKTDNSTNVVIVIADKIQLKCLLQYGNECICIDSTFGVTKYNLKLTTIVVINELGVGIPVTYIISQGTSKDVWIDCFMKLREAVGQRIHTKVFMSDNDNSYYNAWVTVMGWPDHRLLCTWHVTKAWKDHIKKEVPVDKRDIALGQLLNIKKSMSESRYETLTARYRYKWENGAEWEKKILNYFDTYYNKRRREWVNCYRSGLVITTNNYVESFFNNLKNNKHIKGNRRLDRLIHTLLGISRSSYNKYHEMLWRGKGFKDANQARRHRAACGLDAKCLIGKEDGRWKVMIDQLVYIVEESECNQCICLERCGLCGGCAKRLICCCDEYVIKKEVCIHIHFVCILDARLRQTINREKKNRPRVPLVYDVPDDLPPAENLKVSDRDILDMGNLVSKMLSEPIESQLEREQIYSVISRTFHLLNSIKGQVEKEVPDNAPPRTQIRY